MMQIAGRAGFPDVCGKHRQVAFTATGAVWRSAHIGGGHIAPYQRGQVTCSRTRLRGSGSSFPWRRRIRDHFVK